MERTRLNEDTLAGLLFIACGCFGFWISRGLAGGTAGTMGPGYLPRLLCACMIGLGLIIAIRGLVKKGSLQGWQLRPLVMVLGSIFLFAIVLSVAGLLVAAFVTVVVASFATPESRLSEAVVLGIGWAAVAVLVFVYALGLQMNPWPFS